jgi:hypothetical protein
MGVQRTTFDKQQRERAKKAKAAAKRARREDKTPIESDIPELVDLSDDPLATLSAGELLQRVELTHKRFEAGLMSFEEFEEAKAELFARLPVD